MNEKPFHKSQSDSIIFSEDNLGGWTTLNDTIMGGCSSATCYITTGGLVLEGNLVEDGGGFISCRSPILEPPLDLSKFSGLALEVNGQGRVLKLAIGCKNNFLGFAESFYGGLRWTSAVPTNESGKTIKRIPFNILKPTIGAKPFPLPTRFDPSSINQLQLLYSKFDLVGKLNRGFQPGPINIKLHTISAFI